MAESSEPRNVLIALFGFLTVAVVTMVVLLLIVMVNSALQEQFRTKVEQTTSDALREVRVREDEQLHQYAVIDADNGVYRIPIARAMELEARDARMK